MTLTITLPNHLAEQLQRKAEEEKLTAEEVAIDLLEDALEEIWWPTPEDVVAKIKAMPPEPSAIRPAEGSLAEALRRLPPDPEFDLAEWERQWAEVESEMKMMTRVNEIAEGHG
jgi:hypothetical protein